eukprot:TRINITY_DN12413_c0_g1_i2.p1 TRINITY_DN12413_c0_g1~~TRINITY_DN12413_c0_g1_i2.p1  ORF type:complete len:384 (-),score=101.18 TRINITY_DN12413_c0_g1_i2:305-1393(-)
MSHHQHYQPRESSPPPPPTPAAAAVTAVTAPQPHHLSYHPQHPHGEPVPVPASPPEPPPASQPHHLNYHPHSLSLVEGGELEKSTTEIQKEEIKNNQSENRKNENHVIEKHVTDIHVNSKQENFMNGTQIHTYHDKSDDHERLDEEHSNFNLGPDPLNYHYIHHVKNSIDNHVNDNHVQNSGNHHVNNLNHVENHTNHVNNLKHPENHVDNNNNHLNSHHHPSLHDDPPHGSIQVDCTNNCVDPTESKTLNHAGTNSIHDNHGNNSSVPSWNTRNSLFYPSHILPPLREGMGDATSPIPESQYPSLHSCSVFSLPSPMFPVSSPKFPRFPLNPFVPVGSGIKSNGPHIGSMPIGVLIPKSEK